MLNAFWKYILLSNPFVLSAKDSENDMMAHLSIDQIIEAQTEQAILALDSRVGRGGGGDGIRGLRKFAPRWGFPVY